MKRHAWVLSGLILSQAALAAPNMKPGLWELTMSTEMAGMPAAAQRPFTMQRCYRPGEMKDPRATIPQKNPNCQFSDWKESGHTVSWKISCTGKMPLSGSGSVTYSGTSYSGSARLHMSHDGQPMELMHKYTGKRLGDCP